MIGFFACTTLRMLRAYPRAVVGVEAAAAMRRPIAVLRLPPHRRACTARLPVQDIRGLLPAAKRQPMAAAYDPAEVEAEWYEWWERHGMFQPQRSDGGDASDAASTRRRPFSMVLPPPNVTGALHLGHALTVAVQDAVARSRRMRGHETVWVPGLDHAGIATQSVVERSLAQREGVTRRELGREAFLDRVWEWHRQYGGRINSQLRMVGASLDWTRSTFTLDDGHSAAVTDAFLRLFDDGLVYRKDRMVNWCPHLQTAISDIEVDVVQVNGPTQLRLPSGRTAEVGVMHTFGYPVAGADGAPTTAVLDVSTTRLETMLGDAAVAVHPDDPRYASMVGRHVVHPIHGTLLPVVADGDLVDPALGTGVVKITPAHDANDLACARRHGLPEASLMHDDGTLTDEAGPDFAGMDRFAARVAVQQRLQDAGLYRGVEAHDMALGVCSRSGDILEPMLKPQWFVQCDGLAASAAALVRDGTVSVLPRAQEASWFRWLDNIQDWCVSRQLWWGHRIPAFRVVGVDPAVAVALGRAGGARVAVTATATNAAEVWALGACEDDAWRALRAAVPPGTDTSRWALRQDDDVLDTWFSSSVFPLTVFGWRAATGLPDAAARFHPLDVMETGQDILFFWVARMAMVCHHLTGVAPFKSVWLHPIVRDAAGRKMSKSLGNVVDPADVIRGKPLAELQAAVSAGGTPLSPSEVRTSVKALGKEFPQGIPPCGADALRFTLAAYMQQGANINMDVHRVVTHRQFCNKLWNVTRFVLQHLDGRKRTPALGMLQGMSTTGAVTSMADEWLLRRLAAAVRDADDGLETFDLAKSTAALHRFAVHDLCDVYVEWCKAVLSGAAHGDVNATHAVLAQALDGLLRALHPFMPFVTEELWQRLMVTGLDGTGGPLPMPPMPMSVSLAPGVAPEALAGRAVACNHMDVFVDVLGSARGLVKAATDWFPGTKRADCRIVVEVDVDVHTGASREGGADVGVALADKLCSHAAHLQHMLHAGAVEVDTSGSPRPGRHLRAAAAPGVVVALPVLLDREDALQAALGKLAARLEKLRQQQQQLAARLAKLRADDRVPAAAGDKVQKKLDAVDAEVQAVGATWRQLGGA